MKKLRTATARTTKTNYNKGFRNNNIAAANTAAGQGAASSNAMHQTYQTSAGGGDVIIDYTALYNNNLNSNIAP